MTVYINENLCKGCGICIEVCPKDVIIMSEEQNMKGYNLAKVANIDLCIHCKLCEISCPDLAIYVEKE